MRSALSSDIPSPMALRISACHSSGPAWPSSSPCPHSNANSTKPSGSWSKAATASSRSASGSSGFDALPCCIQSRAEALDDLDGAAVLAFEPHALGLGRRDAVLQDLVGCDLVMKLDLRPAFAVEAKLRDGIDLVARQSRHVDADEIALLVIPQLVERIELGDLLQ